jgi:Tfp pilus assembly protein PilX
MKTQKKFQRVRKLLHIADDQGMVMVMAVMVLVVVIMLAVTAAITSTSESRISGIAYQQAQSFHMAEGYTQWGMDSLRTILRSNLYPTPQELSNIHAQAAPSGYALDAFGIQKVDSTTRRVTHGPFRDVDAVVETYAVRSSVSRSNETSTIQQDVEHLALSIFDFFVFFDQDVELYFKVPMTFDGRVHSNGNLYLGTTQGMTFNSSLTAAGHIYHHIKGGGVMSPPADINIMDFWGNYQNMNTGAYWLDALQPTWEGEAIQRWGGTVMDSSHGIQPMWYDLPNPSMDQIEVIKRGLVTDSPEMRQARYYYHAPIRILDGISYDSSGNTINMGPGVIGFDSFYDHRERRMMYLTEIDIGAMEYSISQDLWQATP